MLRPTLKTSLAAIGLTAAMLPLAQAQDAQSGERKAAMCIGCHGIPGYQASFPEVHKVPMIAGQNAKYIASSLAAYKKGDRHHPTMRAIADSLSDADVADLSAYYETLGGGTKVGEVPPASGPAAELLTKGACAACHGANFSTPIDPSYPKLGGQYADYLYVAMKAYATKNNTIVGRNHAIMGAQIQALSHADLKAVAKYLASLDGELKTVPQSRFR